MKDSSFHADVKEKNPDRFEDILNGDILIQEILQSFKNFDRVFENILPELFSPEDDL
ncbi:hypothetical protein LEP1GSC060_0465 [Leptospira weilii serovar Ranarum str. ICFT]|uniref:Uncharacterized protein n=1 Tax=Leptospira weilii serovar Ranarum str. ICFT TaxID=1218598 RepID=N1WV04_9LEPT|nr:hypothetical protein [Leptospira weilii]EMY79708.1 hypothetical protein LEP1GSC060_0465 [Leptospira weilii serovar Ranarum str. ICFT]